MILTLQEALMCFCGHVLLPAHEHRPVGGNNNLIGMYLFCRRCDAFCLREDWEPNHRPIRPRYDDASSQKARYWRNREAGRSGRCASSNHRRCRTVGRHGSRFFLCRCPCHENGREG